MSPTLKDSETTLSRILSHAKPCRCLIHLLLFHLPTNNMMAAVSDLHTQKIGTGITLESQQHSLPSSALTTVSEIMNAQSLIMRQTGEVTRRERRICFVVHTGCFVSVCSSKNPQGFKEVRGNPSPYCCQFCKAVATRLHGLSDVFKIVAADEDRESFQKLLPTSLQSFVIVCVVVLIKRWNRSMELILKGISKQLRASGFKGQCIISLYSVNKIMFILDCALASQ